MMDKYYEKIFRRYGLLLVVVYFITDISFIILMKFPIFIIIIITDIFTDILFTHRLIIKYNVYFLSLIPYIMIANISVVSISQLPTLIAGLTYLLMIASYILASVYFISKYKPKIHNLDIQSIVVFAFALLFYFLSLLRFYAL